MADSLPLSVLELTAKIVSAHVAHNAVAPDALTPLIQAVHRSLTTVGEVESTPDVPVPAAPIKKSVFPDFIICLEDGKKLKMLKRHLRASFGMSPDDYRAKWGLPQDYPMAAPNYAARRSEMAKNAGLGRMRPAEPMVSILPARRAKGSKG